MEVKSFTVFSEVGTRRQPTDQQLKLVLHEDRITVTDQDQKEVRHISLEDVIGLKVVDSRPPLDGSVKCRVELCTFIAEEQIITTDQFTGHRRKIKFISFSFSSADTFEGNHDAALDCRRHIQIQCWRNDRMIFNKSTSAEVTPPEGPSTDATPPRLLVIINPYSGRKKGVKEYHQTVQPFFEIAGIIVEELLVTERANHAKEYVQSFDFTRITGIVTVGGDGTINEIINGIMNRPDYESVLKTPIGIIPTGSGNAVLASLLYEQSEEYSILSAVYQIIRGGIQAIDLAKVTIGGTQQIYMFLSLTWGLIADVDIESEKFRFLGGELRNILGGLKCIAQKRVYRGQLSYIPSITSDPQIDSTTSTAPHDQVIEPQQHTGDSNGRGLEEPGTDHTHTEESTTVNPSNKTKSTSVNSTDDPVNPTDDTESAPVNPTDDTESAPVNPTDDTESTPVNPTDDTESAPVNPTDDTESTTVNPTDDTESTPVNPTSQIDDTQSPLGGAVSGTTPEATPTNDTWVKVEDDFVTVLIGMTPMLSNKVFGHPDVLMGSGKFYIMYAKSSISRKDLLKTMLAMESGEHVTQDNLSFIKASACRIEPLTTSGILAIDGEVVDYGVAEVVMTNVSVNIYSRKKL